MTRSIYGLTLGLFWCASMGWLVSTKLAPVLLPRSLDPYGRSERQQVEHAEWSVLWNGRPIGAASMTIDRGPDGAAQVHNRLELDDLPLAEMARELLGPLAKIIPGGLDTASSEFSGVSMRISTDLQLSPNGTHHGPRVESLQTLVALDGAADLIRVEAEMEGNDKLQLDVFAAIGPEGTDRKIVSRLVDLPGDGQILDSLAPLPRLGNVRLGESWTLPVYRFFPPNNPIQRIRATVESEELLAWNGGLVPTRVVYYRPEPGELPTVGQRLLGRVWIAPGGHVVQQEATFSRITLRFVRKPSDRSEQETMRRGGR